ncbi:MAG: alpha/beta fold hydrolase, partial [Polyangiales bacterium]
MSYDRSTQALDVRGAALAYSDDGAGPLAFYAHGLTASRAVDGRLDLPRFAGLRRAVRLVAYDARGHGESSGGRDPAEYAWSALAEDMHAVLDHFSPDAPASVIGLSMGTGTLLHAAVARPARFARLVLTAPPTAWETRAQQSEMYATLAALAETEPPDKLASLFQQRPIAPIFRDLPPPPPPGLPDITLERMPAVFRGAGRSDLPAPEALRTL